MGKRNRIFGRAFVLTILTISMSFSQVLAASDEWVKEDDIFFNPDGDEITGAKLKGIDVSYHNGDIDWEEVKASDIDYAILRCGYGQDYESQDDSKWYEYADECTRLGIPFGTYLYSYATTVSAAKSEAEHVLRLIEGYQLTYPVYFDMEDGKQGKQTAKRKAQIATAFCTAIEEAGYQVGIYANKYWFENHLTDSYFDTCDKWVAQYNSVCKYEGSYRMWQFTETGRVDGINSNVDINFWFDDAPPYQGNQPGQDKPGEDLSSKDDPEQGKPDENKPTEDTSSKDDPEQGKPDENKPTEDTPSKDDPEQGKPDENKPAEDTSSKDDPEQGKPDENKPTEDTPSKDDPEQGKPDENKPTEDTPSKDQPEQEKPVVKSIKEVKVAPVPVQSYTGNTVRPKPILADGDKLLVKGTDYKVSYKDNIEEGTAEITVTGKGSYTGKISVPFQIEKPKPSKPVLTNISTTKRKVALKWKAAANAERYELYRSDGNKKNYVLIKDLAKKSYTDKKLTKGVKYYYKLRAYRVVNGKKKYGSYVKTNIKVKK